MVSLSRYHDRRCPRQLAVPLFFFVICCFTVCTFLIEIGDVNFALNQTSLKPSIQAMVKGKNCLNYTHSRIRNSALMDVNNFHHLGDSVILWKVPNFTSYEEVAATSGPFTAAPCFRQVHLWGKEIVSFSRRVGDFPCPGQPCGLRLVANTDFKTMRRSDALILYHRTPWNWIEMHHHKPKEQKWIFYSQENPYFSGNILPPKQFYNNTYDYIMSYRDRESHIYGSYGYYSTVQPEVKLTEKINWAENRTGLIAWMASNCQFLGWGRDSFVNALSLYIPVTKYGKCGQKPCPRDERCMRTIRKHKFYLALENTACRDYITEKPWRYALLNNVVPVVFGAPREDYERILPPNSFIHVEDFGSIQDLASYLWNVHTNDFLYNAYFDWKKHGSAHLTTEEYLFEPEQVCRNIVSRLLDDEKAIKEGTYQQPKFPDWHQWWHGSCLHMQTDGWPIRIL